MYLAVMQNAKVPIPLTVQLACAVQISLQRPSTEDTAHMIRDLVYSPQEATLYWERICTEARGYAWQNIARQMQREEQGNVVCYAKICSDERNNLQEMFGLVSGVLQQFHNIGSRASIAWQEYREHLEEKIRYCLRRGLAYSDNGKIIEMGAYLSAKKGLDGLLVLLTEWEQGDLLKNLDEAKVKELIYEAAQKTVYGVINELGMSEQGAPQNPHWFLIYAFGHYTSGKQSGSQLHCAGQNFRPEHSIKNEVTYCAEIEMVYGSLSYEGNPVVNCVVGMKDNLHQAVILYSPDGEHSFSVLEIADLPPLIQQCYLMDFLRQHYPRMHVDVRHCVLYHILNNAKHVIKVRNKGKNWKGPDHLSNVVRYGTGCNTQDAYNDTPLRVHTGDPERLENLCKAVTVVSDTLKHRLKEKNDAWVLHIEFPYDPGSEFDDRPAKILQVKKHYRAAIQALSDAKKRSKRIKRIIDKMEILTTIRNKQTNEPELVVIEDAQNIVRREKMNVCSQYRRTASHYDIAYLQNGDMQVLDERRREMEELFGRQYTMKRFQVVDSRGRPILTGLSPHKRIKMRERVIGHTGTGSVSYYIRRKTDSHPIISM